MNKRKNVILRAVENEIFDETLKKRIVSSLGVDFEYFPGQVVVLFIKKGKYTIKTKKGDDLDDKNKINDEGLIYANIYYAYIREKQANPGKIFEKKEDIKDKNNFKNKDGIALIPKVWIEDGTIVLDKKV